VDGSMRPGDIYAGNLHMMHTELYMAIDLKG